ncbi:MAG: alpha-glucosidase/alpha-galactosidase [Candidatus Bathyarchaeota archaeon]|nr:alpha-glucosidase/alpha-galactosidase [Candidatus Bathyarchaeota archaeon]MDH5687865.1 alpha-glucosidase/alpha-galactosidase [Candidatus Bathyarchaeota archaeon]
MAKIVIIGAGSQVFSRNLITDFLSYPELRNSTITLMDIDEERLNLITAFAKKLVTQHGFDTKVESTTDRQEALRDANYVIVSIRVGGFEANRLDLEIPAKYGIKQAVGDTIGPGGVFYGLRHIPVLLNICHDMEELCPDAWLINYTNPMAMICWAMNDYSSTRNVGLCHSVQGTAGELARYLGAPVDEISYWVAGINHMAWFLELKWRGQDAYPLLREKFEDPNLYSRPDAHWAGPDMVRVEIFKAFGYFNTESSQHMSEYVPYFRKRPELFERFKLAFRIDTMKDMEKRRRRQEEEMRRTIGSDEEIPIHRSREYCSFIIHSIETGIARRINANVKNKRLITNLPKGCCVEVPSLVDRNGIHPCYVGDLPPQCAGLNRSNINVQELGVLAAVEKDKTLAYQAILLDPLTSAMLSIDETRSMVDEMFKAEARYLKDFR